MFASKTTGHLAFMSRQLSHLMESEDVDGALAQLKDASPNQYKNEIAYLSSLFAGTESPQQPLGPNPYRMLSRLLPEVANAKNVFFRGFVDYVRQSKIIFETYWAGVVGMIWYLAALSLVMVVIAVIFAAYVVPSFESMFSQSGVPLPTLTTAVFKFGGKGLPLFVAILGIFVALIVWFVATFHRRIQAIEPLPSWPKWMPIVGRIADYYNAGLFLNFCRLLIESDVAHDHAVSIAAKAANQSGDLSIDSLHDEDGDYADLPIFAELAIAQKLGNFHGELSHQCDEHLGKMSLILIQARDQFSLVLKLLLYIFVATLVIAMYLPIFKMGAVI